MDAELHMFIIYCTVYTVLYIKLLYCISTLTGVLVQIFGSEFGDLR